MGGIKKAVKGVFKGVKKVVKGIAKGIKKVGSGIWKGVKKVVGAVGKVFGKLGPIGSLALGFVLPGIGNMLGGMWSSAAGAMAGSTTGWVSAIGKGMQFAASAASKVGGFISKGVGSITDKISGGLKWIGGKISDGANALFKGAQQFFGVKNPASISDVGQWVAEKAKSTFGIESQTSTGMTQTASGTFNTNLNMPEGWSGMTEQQLTTQYPAAGQINLSGLDTMPKGSIVGLKDYTTNLALGGNIGPSDVLDAGGIDVTPRGTPYDPSAEFRYGDAVPNATDKLMGPDVPKFGKAAETYGNKPDLLGTAMKAGSSILNAYANAGQPQIPQYVPYAFGVGGGVDDPYGSMRAGVGGQGASGGTFLSEAQLMQQQLLAQQLQQLG